MRPREKEVMNTIGSTVTWLKIVKTDLDILKQFFAGGCSEGEVGETVS